MVIEVLPQESCYNCVFCEELIFCSLRDGEHIEFEEDFEKANELFCPLRNKSVKVTDKIRVVTV